MLDEVKNLIFLAQKGEEKAKEELVTRNIGLIRSAVRRFYGRGVSDEDLFQLGAMGLVKAIMRFDLSYDVEFSTYAVPMIIGEIRRFLRDDGMIKVSRSARERAAVIRRMRSEEGDGEIHSIAKKMGISYEEAVFALEATTPPESMDKEIFDSKGGRMRVGDTIPSGESEEERILKIALKTAIEELPERDRELIILRYYREMTQSQVAKIMNMGQVQVSRQEKRIIERIREKIS